MGNGIGITDQQGPLLTGFCIHHSQRCALPLAFWLRSIFHPALLSQVLPEHVVRALYSADWKDREQGVNGCAKILTVAAQSSVEAEPAFNVGCEVLKHTLK